MHVPIAYSTSPLGYLIDISNQMFKTQPWFSPSNFLITVFSNSINDNSIFLDTQALNFESSGHSSFSHLPYPICWQTLPSGDIHNFPLFIMSTTASLVWAAFLSHLDYCSSLPLPLFPPTICSQHSSQGGPVTALVTLCHSSAPLYSLPISLDKTVCQALYDLYLHLTASQNIYPAPSLSAPVAMASLLFFKHIRLSSASGPCDLFRKLFHIIALLSLPLPSIHCSDVTLSDQP